MTAKWQQIANRTSITFLLLTSAESEPERNKRKKRTAVPGGKNKTVLQREVSLQQNNLSLNTAFTVSPS